MMEGWMIEWRNDGIIEWYVLTKKHIFQQQQKLPKKTVFPPPPHKNLFTIEQVLSKNLFSPTNMFCLKTRFHQKNMFLLKSDFH